MMMMISELRAELGLTLEGFAERLGLKSKGYAHDIERGARPSVKVALDIEELSGGRIDAADLNPDVSLVRAARAKAAAAPVDPDVMSVSSAVVQAAAVDADMGQGAALGKAVA